MRASGAELGLRTLALRRYQATVAVWGLDIASELVFVGDAGTTEPSRPSRRLGVEWSNVFAPWPWLAFDADLACSRARFRDRDPAGARIPGAVEGVASAGVSVQEIGRLSGSLRLRYFGPRPLIEDDHVRSRASATLNARARWRVSRPCFLSVDVFNLNTHPLESRSFRLSLTATF